MHRHTEIPQKQNAATKQEKVTENRTESAQIDASSGNSNLTTLPLSLIKLASLASQNGYWTLPRKVSTIGDNMQRTSPSEVLADDGI